MISSWNGEVATINRSTFGIMVALDGVGADVSLAVPISVRFEQLRGLARVQP
jgi:hypothetical protein